MLSSIDWNLMGFDLAPFMADLNMYYYERKLLLQIKKRILRKALIFFSIVRFIDDYVFSITMNLKITTMYLS